MKRFVFAHKAKRFAAAAVLAAGVLIISTAAGPASAQTESAPTGAVEINESNFPDEIFREYVTKFDTDGDNVLSADELSGVTAISVYEEGISDLTGIEYFDELITLNCSKNNLSSLDVSSNTQLTNLSCHDNNLSSLDISSNTELTDLTCYNNSLSSLDVSNNTKLTYLHCYSNNLSSLDVSSNTKLIYLFCGSNNLSSLDVSSNTELTYFSCFSNNLSSLDVSSNAALKDFNCGDNNLSSLDVSSNTELTYLACYSNNLSSLDISSNTELTELYCYGNNLSSLDLSSNAALNYLSCKNNKISLPLYEDGEIYYLDLSAVIPAAERVENPSEGSYDSTAVRINLEKALETGDTLTYDYVTGYNEESMTVTVTISEVIDTSSIVTPEPSEEPTETPTPEPTEEPTATPEPTEEPTPSTAAATEPTADSGSDDTPKTGDAVNPAVLIAIGLFSAAGIVFLKKTKLQ